MISGGFCLTPLATHVLVCACPLPCTITDYVVTMPNMYARGILFGKMVLELGDYCVVKNEKHGLYCDLEFKTKVSSFCLCYHHSLHRVSYTLRMLLRVGCP